MSDAREPGGPSDSKGGEPDQTHVERGARVARTRQQQKSKAAEADAPQGAAPGTPPAPAFEQTFTAEENSDVSEPETLIWSGEPLDLSAEVEANDAASANEVHWDGTEERTRTVLDSELSEATAAPAPAELDPHAWYLGRSFGGFRIVRAIAAGGMATVFLARKEGPARVSKHAAIKVVHPHLAYEREFVHMFLDEARIAALIDHPNVCHVLDFGMAEGTYYLAMEYLLGETWSTVRTALAEHPEGARMVPAVAAYVLAQACEGLAAAHTALDDNGHPLAIVHRDISPQNIFVAYDGTVRVLDFGIARAADRITSTRDGVLKGRLAYMSPEQMSIAEVGAAADIWSIGVVLREALEGKRLFRRATDAETMLAVTQEPLPAWSEQVPAELRAICDRALARDPRDRYPNAHTLARELMQFAQSTRNQVGSSELSVWMGLLFAAQMEQKRALLQLPMPAPRAGGAPLAPPLLEEAAEPSEASMPARGPSTMPARPEKKKPSLRPLWLNPPALIALASIGAIVGVLLGKILHGDPLREQRFAGPPTPAASARGPKPVVDQLEAPAQKPTVSQLEPKAEASGRAQAPENPSVTPLTPAVEPVRTAERSPMREPVAPSIKPAPRAPAPATAANGATGTLLIAFEGGWAEVSLGEKRLGTTPGRFVVPAGKHSLTVRPFGTGKPFAKQVELAPNQVLKVFLAPPK